MASKTPSLTQLQRALALAERIQTLEQELASLLGGKVSSPNAPSSATAPGARGKRTRSAATRARMSAAQQARRAGTKTTNQDAGQSPAPAKTTRTGKKKRLLSAEGRARIIAAAKARPAKARPAKARPAKARPATRRKDSGS